MIRRQASAFMVFVVILASCAIASSSGGPSHSASPRPGAAATPIDTARWSAFTSDWHGYVMRYPADWTANKATRPWIFGRNGDDPNDPTVDRFDAPQPPSALVVSSQAIPKGVTEAEWWSAYMAAMAHHVPGCAPPREQWETITIGGQPASLHGGLPQCDYTEAVAVVAGRAYVFTAYADVDAPSGGVFDRKLFDAFLSTVSFHLDAANP